MDLANINNEDEGFASETSDEGYNSDEMRNEEGACRKALRKCFQWAVDELFVERDQDNSDEDNNNINNDDDEEGEEEEEYDEEEEEDENNIEGAGTSSNNNVVSKEDESLKSENNNTPLQKVQVEIEREVAAQNNQDHQFDSKIKVIKKEDTLLDDENAVDIKKRKKSEKDR
ncbi:uncharacterized protein [Palaemon carinicauda]|uniref:uncharacterized protein n=1 Tax=Palaemon carinicauda TaxID=392227 RepID=UPI0035B597AC